MNSNRPTYVGVCSANGYLGTGVSALKKYFLIYDQIALLRLDEAKQSLREHSTRKIRLADEFENLQDQGLIISAEIPENSVDPDITADLGAAAKLIHEIRTKPAKGDEEINQKLENIWLANSYISRATASAMRKEGSSHAFSLLPPRAWTAGPLPSRRDAILQIVINGFPEIAEDVILGDILQLRAESEFIKRRDAIRIWTRKTAEGKSSIEDIQEELLYLRNEYETYMRAIKVKYTLTTVGAVAKFAVGVVADVATLRWKDAVETLFSLSVVPATLTEAEQKAPGRELSFLTYINDKYS
jgi:hypothetical protein